MISLRGQAGFLDSWVNPSFGQFHHVHAATTHVPFPLTLELSAQPSIWVTVANFSLYTKREIVRLWKLCDLSPGQSYQYFVLVLGSASPVLPRRLEALCTACYLPLVTAGFFHYTRGFASVKRLCIFPRCPIRTHAGEVRRMQALHGWFSPPLGTFPAMALPPPFRAAAALNAPLEELTQHPTVLIVVRTSNPDPPQANAFIYRFIYTI